MSVDNLQAIVDEIREDLAKTRMCFYRIDLGDGRELFFEVVPDGVTSIRMWSINDGPLEKETVDPEELVRGLYVWIRGIMRGKPRTQDLAS